MARKKVSKKFVRPSRQTIALFLLGAALLVAFTAYRIYRTTILSFSQFPTTYTQDVRRNPENLPTVVEIAQVNMSVPVEETSIVNGRWQIAQKGASHLAQSSSPTEEKGSIILYAHNSRDRFAPLHRTKIGDTVNIKTRGGSVVSYVISQKLVVSPSNVDILTSTEKETLILYTCTGFADTKRLVIKALPL